MSTQEQQTPAGWYPDAQNPALLRYWDGGGWTEHTQPAPEAASAPPAGFVPSPLGELRVAPNADMGGAGLNGLDGMTGAQLKADLEAGGSFRVYPYAISVIVLSFKRGSGVYYVPAGKSPVGKGLPFALISALAGWWGFPWGPIFTVSSLVRVFRGGVDVTGAAVDLLNEAHARGAIGTVDQRALSNTAHATIKDLPQAPPPGQPAGPPPGWHADPHGQARLRYWDGVQWTGHVTN